MVFECEGSSVRARARWSASSRAFECEGSRAIYIALAGGARNPEACGRHAVITVHIELPVLESHVAPIIIQRNYRYKLANMLYACYSSSNC